MSAKWNPDCFILFMGTGFRFTNEKRDVPMKESKRFMFHYIVL